MGRPPIEFDPARYWEDRLQVFDLEAVGYSGVGLPYNRWLYRLRHVAFQRLARTVGDWEGTEVLDVGSGTGFYVSEWKHLKACVTGSDLTRTAVQNLSQAFPDTRFVQLDVGEPPACPPASFDAISAVDVLFHIVDDARYEAALRNIASLLKVGGHFFFSENFLHGETVSGLHQASRSLRRIEAMLAGAGLELVLRRPMFVLMNAPVDSDNRLLNAYWSALSGGLSRFPSLGGVAGALLYPLERLLVSLCKESPSTEFAVCRKSSGD